MPMPSDPFAVPHWNMVQAHQTFKVGYDNIARLLEDPPMNDLNNFLGYCEAWALSIGGHHDTEEHVVFPFLNQKMDFSGEIEQHKGIHAALDRLVETIHSAQVDQSKFDAEAMQKLMKDFREPLFTHLDEEVEHLLPAKIRAAGFTEAEVTQNSADMLAFAKGHGDPFMNVPFMVSHTAPEHKAEWPGIPWAVRKGIIPYVLAMRHRGYWKYSPYALS